MASDAAAQLADEVGAVAEALGNLLGTDVGDLLRERLEQRAQGIAASVGGPGDGADLLVILGDRPPPWWRTPLGLAVAAGQAGDEAAMTYASAADVLGVHRGTVAQLAARGTLERHPEGGVRRGAVMARLCRLRGQR